MGVHEAALIVLLKLLPSVQFAHWRSLVLVVLAVTKVPTGQACAVVQVKELAAVEKLDVPLHSPHCRSETVVTFTVMNWPAVQFLVALQTRSDDAVAATDSNSTCAAHDFTAVHDT